MHLQENQPEHVSDLATKLRDLTDILVQGMPRGEPIQVEHSADLFADRPPQQLLLLTAGQVLLERKGKTVLTFDTGDLLGLSKSLQLPEGKLVALDATFVSIDRDQLMQHVNASGELQRHWAYYLICLSTYYREAFTLEKRSHFQPSTGFMSFGTGETIIAQGDTANCVYTLLEGSAIATRDGVKVGEIHAEEIFGALAVFTRQARNASVIATSDCSVMAVRKEDFIDFVEDQPHVCLNLIEEMADKINQLNLQIAGRG